MKPFKFAIFTIIVIVIEFGISYLVANKFNIRLIDSIFSVGLLLSLFSLFFSSSGGLFSNYSDVKIASSYIGLKNNYKIKRTFEAFNINCFNLGSILFFLIGLVVAIGIYVI